MSRTATRILAGAVLLTASAAAQHEHHQQPAKPAATRTDAVLPAAPDGEFAVERLVKLPQAFAGVWTFDISSGRLWLLSYGPPANTKGNSTLYEMNLDTGAFAAQVRMPFLGECSGLVFLDGFLYVGVPHEAKIHKLLAQDSKVLGRTAGTLAVPSLIDLKTTSDEPFRFPFLSFFGLTVTPERHLLLHAQEIGELITLDRETGAIVKRVRTLRGLGGIATVPGPNGEFLLLANADPAAAALRAEMRRFMFRSTHGITPPYDVRTETACGRAEARDLRWTLIDAQTGEALAASAQQCTRSVAGSIALLGFQKTPGTRYGSFRFIAGGEQGTLAVMKWTPAASSFQ